jgi:hypothetical protein
VSSTTVKSELNRLSWAIIAFRNGSVSGGTRPLSAQNRLLASTYFRQLVVGKIGETVQMQWDGHGSSGSGEAPIG